MNRTTKLSLGLAAAAVIAALAFAVMERYRLAPDFTLSLRSGSGSAASEYLNAQRSVDFYREAINATPGVVKNYVELAQIFLQEGRITGRHHEYIPKADFLVTAALDRDPRNYEAAILKATILMSKHHFREARETAALAVSRSPKIGAGYGILCDADVELGLYDEAVSACDAMLGIRPDLRSYSRASYLREIHGDTRGAIAAMRMACDAGMDGQEGRVWALYN